MRELVSATIPVGRRGTVVLPARIRRELNIADGDLLQMYIDSCGQLIVKRVPADPLERLRWAAGQSFRGIDPVAYQRALRDEDEE